MRIVRTALLVLLASGLVVAEWRGFRGAGGNGVSEETGLPLDWSESRNVAWKTPIPGKGHSSPIIAGGRIFLTTSEELEAIPGKKAPAHKLQGEPFVHPQTAAEDRRVQLFGLAIDAASGRVLWNQKLYDGPVHDGRHQFNTFASPTPATDGKRVFFYFEAQGLYALDLEGKPVWKRSFGGISKVGLAGGTSPVLAGGVLVIVADEDEGKQSRIYGLSPSTGEILWQKPRTASVTWNTPVAVRSGSRDLVIAAATEHVTAYDARTGEVAWTGPGIQGFGAASPVSLGDLVFPNAYHPTKMVYAMRVDPAASERVAWKFEKGTAYIPSPIAYRGHLYLMAGNGALTCLEAATGKLIYEGKRVPTPAKFTASPVAFDGRILLTSDDGDTHVIQAGPEHKLVATNSIGEPVHASLALDKGAIYIRGARHLYRISRSSAP